MYGISENIYLRIERVKLYLYSLSGPPWPVIWRNLPYLYLYLFTYICDVYNIYVCLGVVLQRPLYMYGEYSSGPYG
jgi:hypothetical protein